MNTAIKISLTEIKAERTSTSAISNMLKGKIPFSYERKLAPAVDYSFEGILICAIIVNTCTTFHADIAKRILSCDEITDKQRFALAAYFCEMDLTIGQIKEAIIARWDEEFLNEED